MSIKYRNQSGQETIISGLTPGGDIEAGAVMTRTGTFNITFNGSTTSEGNVAVTFNEPMPDNDYEVSFSYNGQWTGVALYANNKTANGFNVCYANIVSSTATRTYNYKAIKTYTVQHAQQNAESIANIEAMLPTGAGSGNKLVTKSYVDNADTALTGRVDDLEDLIPANADVTNQLVTKAQLDTKQNTLTFDSTPTANSNNPVTSAGIKAALDAIDVDELETRVDSIDNVTGAKNLFDGYFTPGVLTAGREYTNQIISRQILYPDTRYVTFGVYLEPGRYIISVHGEDYLSLNRVALAGTNCVNSSAHLRNSYTFTTTTKGWSYFSIERDQGETDYTDIFFEGHDLKIMIRDADIEDTTYRETSLSNMQLSAEIDRLHKEIEILMNQLTVKNVLPNLGLSTYSLNNVNFTRQADGSVLIDTAGKSASAYTLYNMFNTSPTPVIKNTNGLVVSASGLTGVSLRVKDTDEVWYGQPLYEEIVPAGKDITSVVIAVGNGVAVNNFTMYPMIRPLGIQSASYAPYAQTNRQLREYQPGDSITVNQVYCFGVYESTAQLRANIPLSKDISRNVTSVTITAQYVEVYCNGTDRNITSNVAAAAGAIFRPNQVRITCTPTGSAFPDAVLHQDVLVCVSAIITFN